MPSAAGSGTAVIQIDDLSGLKAAQIETRQDARLKETVAVDGIDEVQATKLFWRAGQREIDFAGEAADGDVARLAGADPRYGLKRRGVSA
jgi:hypothetical protein